MTEEQASNGGAVPPSDVGEADQTDVLESRWVRISEVIHADGTPELVLTNSEPLTPWDMGGMLTAACEFQKTLVTNIFYGASFEDMAFGEDDEDGYICPECQADEDDLGGPFS